jgi:hypothetical protein
MSFHVNCTLTAEKCVLLCKHAAQVAWSSLKCLVIKNIYFPFQITFYQLVHVSLPPFIYLHVSLTFDQPLPFEQASKNSSAMQTSSPATQILCRSFATNSVYNHFTTHPLFFSFCCVKTNGPNLMLNAYMYTFSKPSFCIIDFPMVNLSKP